ncbi:site-specific DNA-methyltransferase [Halomonas sp. QX-2]|uniref:Site-specific DNA-methyltransferase n=1 Tax=Vreelandella sedimenti TaxID=2729618 RepID=A0A7Z0N6D1_9GAMM|nr:site-specific DNA-methyltransferase [Halomonas sedimenti]NYT72482.1 site-specific DNA-methyltransferase [Halomonas sedimenti]
MAHGKQDSKNAQQSGTYSHQQDAVQRPDVGVQPEFNVRKPPKNYRYDSSLAPELVWDENAERDMAEWLLSLVEKTADKGEQALFSEPQVWLGTGEKFHSLAECIARLRSLTKPFLNWAGKAERQQISVPTIPLFVHERHSTQAILETLESYKSSGSTLDLFGDPELDVTDKLDAYEHKGPWTNRMVLGDSLQVMNSLLEYEGLGGQVQMIYVDPPYGVKFGSNFQPFVRKRDVKHGKDDEMIREPEMVKAYRDTWELGSHSYLTYIRDRVLMARELLTQSGSIFVQISDENLDSVKAVLSEVFGKDNFMAIISYRVKSPLGVNHLGRVNDFIIWFAKDKEKVRYNQLYIPKSLQSNSEFDRVELDNGDEYTIAEYLKKHDELPENARFYTGQNLASSGRTESCLYDYELDGTIYKSPRGKSWKTTKKGMRKLEEKNRLLGLKSSLRWKYYLDDFSVQEISNVWNDTFAEPKRAYAVQTAMLPIQRCMLMTTDPGDLVFDPTCGSGTTAYVAEQWGRRWISCDTSRVPLALARQRLLTATFPWYELKEPDRGLSAGFKYTRKQNKKGEEVGGLVPRITLKSIANDESPVTATLVDKPDVNKTITRVCGPFTVEATIQATGTLLEDTKGIKEKNDSQDEPRKYLDRMIEVLRQSRTLRLPGNKSLEFDRVRPLGTEYEHLHAEGVEQNGEDRRIAVMFGPQDGAIDSGIVLEAAREAWFAKFDAIYFFGFAIQAKARELIENRGKLKLPCTYVSVTPDVVMSDLLKTSKSSEVFSITGLPDLELRLTGDSSTDSNQLFEVELLGLDIFRPQDLETESIEADNLPCWMLDTDYNGMAFIARQVFFPKTSAWDNLQRSLKAKFDASVWEHLAGTISEPFVLGRNKRIAVKVIDDRGNELMVVREASEANS